MIQEFPSQFFPTALGIRGCPAKRCLKVLGLEENGHPWCDTACMKKTNASSTQKMDASREFCPNDACASRGKIGQGNIVIHDSSRGRYRCKVCKKTFNKRRGTALEGIRKPEELFVTGTAALNGGDTLI